jgi:hypothetical protein
VRLDHLLSKEHWSRKRSRAWPECECRSAGAQGWNIDYLALTPARLASTSPSGQWNADGMGPAPDTLLGPEGSGESSPSGRLNGLGPLLRMNHRPCRQAPVPGGGRPYLENYTVDASIFVAQVYKGTRWMPWHQEPKKDVGICDKPRGVDNQTVIRGFPNGETRLEASPVTLV